ncbi:hypothetical protein J4U01_gp104 [Mycobacterium phage Kumao]|uniref:Uncharacterized protein n=1 Tax=Mycobacterium phage Kumao TaxID=2041344 RepID=A0A2D1GPX7_9CAUD|nr:hypothetical protein J4U01_gp104 [Mycobacterium phage Kumao]ATN94054.1 hypothetical protein SEA_KUMAO_92 [Mycobacterium phage Kumao]
MIKLKVFGVEVVTLEFEVPDGATELAPVGKVVDKGVNRISRFWVDRMLGR